MQEQATPIDRSYGVIPLRERNGVRQVLVVKNKGGHWSFPKGHPEGTETPIETAQRELREETGITDCAVEELPVFSEQFELQKDRQTIDRKIVFFLGLVETDNLTIQPNEIHESAWLPFDEALAQLTFDDTKQLFTKVVDHLATK